MEIIHNYINGELVPPVSGNYFDNIEPATGQIYGKIPDSDSEDIAIAAKAAKDAFKDWSEKSASERSELMLKIADLIESQLEVFARTESIDNGKPISLARAVDIPLEALVGPEFVTGSTRMKAGTAQKLILNMITTSTMIKLGRVKGNKMVDMQLTNAKLVERGSRMISEELGLEREESPRLLLLHGSVRNVLNSFKQES